MKNAIMAALPLVTMSTLGCDSSVCRNGAITYKSSKAGSALLPMGVELAEAMKAGTDGQVIVTLERKARARSRTVNGRSERAAADMCSTNARPRSFQALHQVVRRCFLKERETPL